MQRYKNAHGVIYKKSGLYTILCKPELESRTIFVMKFIDVDQITKEMVLEDYEGFEIGRNFFTRVNKHGVEFTIKGARFWYDGTEYEICLPYQSDITHIYTPQMLMEMYQKHGEYSHKSQDWKPNSPVKPASELYIDNLE